MRRARLLPIMLLLVVCLCGAKRPDDVPIPELTFSPPKTERLVLDNGMVVHLLEDHELPLFDVVAYFRTGSIYDPEDKIGLAGLTGVVMRTGGTETMTGDEIDEELEFMAGSVETSIGIEAAIASLSVLKDDIDRGIEIFADVVRNPAFRDEKVQLAKNQALEGIRRRYDTPGGTAAAEFPKLVYGARSPWARLSTVSTVENVVRADMVAFHKKYFHPNNMILGVAGDFDSKEIVSKIERVFAGWEQAEIAFPDVGLIEKRFAGSVHHIQREINQSNIRMGHFGLRRHSPERYAVNVLNYILGLGGFTSRLMREVRSNRGLAYSVGARLGAGTDCGLFYAVCQTKGGTTREAIDVMTDVIGSVTEEVVTDEELKTAKDTLLNSFVFNFQSSTQVASQRVRLEFFGYPDDYLETYQANTAAVTAEDVLNAARKYLHPDTMTILVVGNSNEFDKPLSELGPVKEIDIEALKQAR